MQISTRQAACLGLITLLLTGLIYWPGLHGGYLLDDFSVLGGLEAIKAPLDWTKIWRFALSQDFTGPTGRPLSLLSFAVQYASWPTDPLAFKLVNLLIHLTNAVLVGLLVWQLLQVAGSRSESAGLAAVVAMSIWCLHPVQISTVLYVVQRMAMLAAMFSLLAANVYLLGRARVVRGEPRAGFAIMLAAMALLGGLGLLAKESAAVLPLLLLVLEITILARQPLPRWWTAIFLGIPTLIIFGYLVYCGIFASYATRNFTMSERLMSQGRILCEYLVKIILPTRKSFGIFFDDYAPSRSLFSPISTLPSIAVVLGLLVFALKNRLRWPVVSAGVLWFFAAHVIEGTTVPLELYFEHRNYVALIGPAMILGWVLASDWSRVLPKVGGAIRYGVVAYIGLLGLITMQECRLWADPLTLFQAWSTERPSSTRAQVALADQLANEGRLGEAADVQWRMAARYPEQASYISLVNYHCADAAVKIPTDDFNRKYYAGHEYSIGIMNTLTTIGDAIEQGKCPYLNGEYFNHIVDALLVNPHYQMADPLAQLYFLKGRMKALAHDYAAALDLLDISYSHEARFETRLIQGAWAVQAGDSRRAHDYLDKTRDYARKHPDRAYLYAEVVGKLGDLVTALDAKERKQ